MNEKKLIIGYTTGVFDLFHIGHLNVLNNAKAMCDKLIVGVTIDKLVTYKNTTAVIPFSERVEIVKNIKCVDLVVPQVNMDKTEAWQKLKFDLVFVGDDWYQNERWEKFEKDLSKFGVKVIYLPYTKQTNSTLLKKALKKVTQN